MLRRWPWVLLAIASASLAAALLTGASAAAFLLLAPEAGEGISVALSLATFVGLAAAPCWAAGLLVLGLPLGLALARIGRDGYATAMIAGALGGMAALLISLVVFGGLAAPDLLLVYPLLMIAPGAAAGAIVRRLAYATRPRGRAS